MGSYIVTVDTGGSKTQISLFDFEGTRISESRCVGIGVAQGSDTSLHHLKDALEHLMRGREYSEVAKVVINVGGANVKEIREEIAVYFPCAKVEAYRESSGVLMEALCRAEDVDVILMVGTGSIALARGRKGNVIADGWCPNVGDGGSGYWIGLQAISRSVKALEKEEKLPHIAKLITGRESSFTAVENTMEQMRMRDQVRTNFMPLERAAVAGLTRTAAQCAREGDAMAASIFSDAGKELAETVLRAIKLADCKKPTEILVSGGLTGCADLWGEAFQETLLKESNDCKWRVGDADMTKGALFYALHDMTE